MKWNVVLHTSVDKKLKKLPEKISLLTQLLANDLRMFGTHPGKQ